MRSGTSGTETVAARRGAIGATRDQAQKSSPSISQFTMFMRRVMVRHRVGTWLREARDLLTLAGTGKRYFEEAGSLANDRLCRKLMTGLVPNGKAFLDIGSHIGSVIAEIHQNCPGANVVAFEAIPEKVAFLKRAFPQARIVSCAVGRTNAKILFHVDCRESGNSSISSTIMPESHGLQTITVTQRRLDSIEELPGAIDSMKIDVEGAEQGVIEGASQLLIEQRPIIYFESGPNEILDMGFTKHGLWSALTERGYTIHVPNRVAHADKGLSLEMFLDSHQYPRRTSNYIAIPIERRAEYRDRVRKFLKF
jgi:FkbM family methyltransferase